jgi:hypothetical protein
MDAQIRMNKMATEAKCSLKALIEVVEHKSFSPPAAATHGLVLLRT